MYQVTVNGNKIGDITLESQGIWLNENKINWSAAKTDDHVYSLLYDQQSFTGELVQADWENKKLTIRIKGVDYVVQISEPMDQLLDEMGIRSAGKKQINEIRAPMPGLVLKILVEAGQPVKAGDPIIILEAMKMENIFKAAADAIVKEIKVNEKTPVEKGEVLVIME